MTEIKRWSRRLERVLKQMPKGYEGIVGYTTIDIYPTGTLDKHLGSSMDGYGISKSPLHMIDSGKLTPYSEGS
jgi:hypothetical protein